MKISYRNRTPIGLSVLFIVLVTLSCTMPVYWVAPHSTVTPPPLETFFQTTALSNPQETITPPPTPDDPPPLYPTTPTPAIPEENTTPILYYSQAADSLPVVAVRFGVQVSEIKSPDPLPETGFLNPGHLLIIPRRLGNTTSALHLLPDSEVVFSPSAASFDVRTFVDEAAGHLSEAHEWLKSSGTISGADVLMRVAIENSINPRLLLSLLEFQSHWVYGQPKDLAQRDYPMGRIDLNQKTLYRQLVWVVNQLSIGYYAYREGRLTEISFPDGVKGRLAPDLNAGTAALQYLFAQLYQGQQWLDVLDPTNGFPALHERMFGSSWTRANDVEPLFPPDLVQPRLILPFYRNYLWSYTGGPHGAWEHEGAYAALDFAPGSIEPGCSDSNAWALAAASGMVVRSGNGVVVLDLDGDGYEQTGWVLLYLHIVTDKAFHPGDWVDAGDPLGHPSCEGGVSTGTHLHIARKYNGEWIPASGPLPFNLGGWVAHAGAEAYKGSLTRNGETIEACTCGSFATRIIRTDSDP